MGLILVVDDEAPLRDFLVEMLTDLGQRVVEASNGRQALALAGAESPDLVISDVMMPVMGGVELTRRLRAGEAGRPDVPVILMSSAGRAWAEGAGADAFIDMPFDLDTLEALISTWLR